MEKKWGQGYTEHKGEPDTESDTEYEEETTANEGKQALTMDEINLEAGKKESQEYRKGYNHEDYNLLTEGILDRLMWPTTPAVLLKWMRTWVDWDYRACKRQTTKNRRTTMALVRLSMDRT